MSPRKLSDADKSDILSLYRNPEETTSTLAVRYGVSNSTISRILKSNLVESEYEELIQQKRLNRTPHGASSTAISTHEPLVEFEEEVEATPVIESSAPPIESDTASSESSYEGGRRRRRRSSVPLSSDIQETAVQTQLPLDFTASDQKDEFDESDESFDDLEQEDTSRLEELLDDDLMDLDDEEEDLDEDLDDEWEDEPEEAQSRELIKTSFSQRGINVQVLPFSAASLPRTCYLVVDRAAELIARPLREFSDLGQIPAGEIQEKTLPVFDNHKVARRFSNRSQRVIKVPDSRMLQKACSHLQAKGITRLLIDGQVYALQPTQP